MACCVFCKRSQANFKTREHILPESLGGGEWSILPSGLFCDDCQNIFGSKIEQQALGNYPLSYFRVFLGIPTKKKKAPWFRSWQGTIEASPVPGTFRYEPAPMFEKAFFEGTKSQMRLPAYPSKPDMICRFLIKMGIEVVAADNPKEAFHSKFDLARRYALTGNKPGNWWYLQREIAEEADYYIRNGVSKYNWEQKVNLEVMQLGKGQEVFHIQLLYLDMFTPLTELVRPDMTGLDEPEFRLFRV